jgi:hypothetical protein
MQVGSRPRRKSSAGKSIDHFDEVVKGTFIEDRQTAVNRCRLNERVELRHEPTNPKDRNAIAVDRLDGSPIGYLPKGVGAPMLRKAAKGYRYSAFIKKFMDPNDRFDSRGVIVWIIEAKPGVSDGDAQDYVDDLLRRGRA